MLELSRIAVKDIVECVWLALDKHLILGRRCSSTKLPPKLDWDLFICCWVPSTSTNWWCPWLAPLSDIGYGKISYSQSVHLFIIRWEFGVDTPLHTDLVCADTVGWRSCAWCVVLRRQVIRVRSFYYGALVPGSDPLYASVSPHCYSFPWRHFRFVYKLSQLPTTKGCIIIRDNLLWQVSFKTIDCN